MLLDSRKSMAANGNYHTRTTIAARSLIAADSLTTMFMGIAFGVVIASVFRAADPVLAVAAVLWCVLYLLFTQRSLRAASREVTTALQDQAVARGRVLQAALRKDVFHAAAEAHASAEEDGLRTSPHLQRIIKGRGLAGWYFRRLEARTLREVRAAYHDDGISLSILAPHTWQDLSTAEDANGSVPERL